MRRQLDSAFFACISISRLHGGAIMKRSQAMAVPLPSGTRYFRTHLRLHIGQAAFFVLSLALVLGGCATGGLQQASSPDVVGLSSDRLKDISTAFMAGVDKKEIPGAVILIARHGKIGYFEAFGYRDRETGAPMNRDAIFRIASMTKPVTIVAAMTLIEQGRLNLSDPVSRHLPEFADRSEERRVGKECRSRGRADQS